MDRGEFIRNGYKVTSCDGGSWLVTQLQPEHLVASGRAFSNARDLMNWLGDEHAALAGGAAATAEKGGDGATTAACRPVMIGEGLVTFAVDGDTVAALEAAGGKFIVDGLRLKALIPRTAPDDYRLLRRVGRALDLATGCSVRQQEDADYGRAVLRW